jgi:hypothetical protein
MQIKHTLYLMIVIACIFGGGNAGAADAPEPAVAPAPVIVPAPSSAPPARRPRAAVPKDERELYVSVADYGWREIDPVDGSRLMTESGALLGLGFSYEHAFEDKINLKLGIELFGGNVDYDGQTQAGVAVQTDTTYLGLKLKGDVGGNYVLSPKWTVKPFLGLGLWTWTRTASDSIAADGTIAYGYSEDWMVFHFRLGVQSAFQLSDSSRFFVEGGMKLPIYNENYAHIDSGITINPGKKVSYFAETGVRTGKVKFSLFYDGLRFSLSSPVNGFVQPESIADMVGVKVGVLF